jgi:predicted permease
MRAVITRIAAAFQRRKLDGELDEELRAHLEMAAEEHRRRGLSEKDARQAALRDFGGVTQVRERVRAREGLLWVENLRRDVGYALRQMRKSPGFALLTTLILTLGIGINTAIFSVVHHILLEPLPFREPGQLYAVWARSDALGNARIYASGPDFLDYQDQSKSFSSIVEMVPHFTETWTGDGDPKLMDCAGISEGFFAMLGIRPVMGRFYTSKEYADLHNPTMVVSYRFWKSRLGGDPHVLGRVIHSDGGENVIIGVAPPLPDLFPDADEYPELTTRPSWDFMKWRKNKFLTVIGRLKPGVTTAMAQDELTGILRRAPGEPPDVRVQLTPLKDDLVGSVRTQLQFILVAVALVLLVACINVAALLLARSARRSSEMAVRLSLGAGRNRLRQQLLVEGLVLTVLACSPGIYAAWLALHLLPHLSGLGLPRLEGVHLNGTALLVTGGIAVLTTLLFGWAPSMTFSRLDLTSTLRTGRTETGRAHYRSFSALVIAEIACSIVLSIGAGLLLHSYWRLERVDPGFEPGHMLTTYLRTNYYSAEGRSFWRDVLQGVANLPGVRAAALADCTPGRRAAIATLVFSDRPNDPNHAPVAEGCWTSADFFRVSGTPLIRGRFFNAGDNPDSPPVVIINEQTAREYWPGENPIGQRIGVNYTGPGRVGTSAPRMREIVGVVQGMKHGPLESPTDPALYMPYLQDETDHDMASMSLFVRSAGDPLALDSAIRARIHAIAPDQPVEEIQSMEDVVSRSLAPRRYSLSLLGAFAVLALLLSAVGIYGIVSYTTQQRTREFGIRIAVGAARSDLMGVVFRYGLVLTLAGALIGVGAALLFTRTLTQLLFGISPVDATSFGFSVVLLGLISLVACLIPALRAAQLDPVRALRSE